jgi:hypothetical protein
MDRLKDRLASELDELPVPQRSASDAIAFGAWRRKLRKAATIGVASVAALGSIALVSRAFDDSSGRIGGGPGGRAPTAESIIRDGGPLGRELAELLNLELMHGFDGSCSFYAEIREDGTGYCLDGIEDDDRAHQWVIAEALRGRALSAEELAAVEEYLREGGDNPGPDGAASEVFAEGRDPIAGDWSLKIEPTKDGPKLILLGGSAPASILIHPVGPGVFGDWIVASRDGDALLLVQLVNDSVDRGLLRFDNGETVDSVVRPVPPGAIGDASVLVAGFHGDMCCEGTELTPSGSVVVFAGDKQVGERPIGGE